MDFLIETAWKPLCLLLVGKKKSIPTGNTFDVSKLACGTHEPVYPRFREISMLTCFILLIKLSLIKLIVTRLLGPEILKLATILPS